MAEKHVRNQNSKIHMYCIQKDRVDSVLSWDSRVNDLTCVEYQLFIEIGVIFVKDLLLFVFIGVKNAN